MSIYWQNVVACPYRRLAGVSRLATFWPFRQIEIIVRPYPQRTAVRRRIGACPQ